MQINDLAAAQRLHFLTAKMLYDTQRLVLTTSASSAATLSSQ